MKKLLNKSLLLMIFALSAAMFSCSDSETPSEIPGWKPRPPKEVADQTVLFYLSGQSLLSYFRDYNVEEIRKAIDEYILYDSRLLVHIQPNRGESLLIEYSFDYEKQRSHADTLRRYSGSKSIEQYHIVKVLKDVKTLAPAEKYGMVLGSHGGGWVDKAYLNLKNSESSTYAIANEEFDPLYKSEGAEATRWFGEDYSTTGSRESANISTWAAALDEADIEMEYLIFDACFMSNIETLYELRNSAKYIVASPCEIMARGIPYDTAVKYLFVNEGKDYDLHSFCNAYYNYYQTTTTTQKSGCIALTVCSEIEPLAQICRQIFATSDKVLKSDIQTYEGLYPHLFYDFKQYIDIICTDATLLDEFNRQFDICFPKESRLNTPGFYSGYNGRLNAINYYSGVTTSTPSVKYPTTYAQTEWAKATMN